MATEIETVITEEQAEFARSKGWSPGADLGWFRPDLWVSESGCIRVYPQRRWGVIECWVAAVFSRAEDRIPHTTKTYRYFKEAIAANS
jgi:hypothetical protein